jgi:hypothetical protein
MMAPGDFGGSMCEARFALSDTAAAMDAEVLDAYLSYTIRTA